VRPRLSGLADRRRSALVAGLALSALLPGLIMTAPAGRAAGSPAAAAAPDNVVAKTHGPRWRGARTVTYCRQGGHALAMTLFAPARVGHPVPVVLQVHGGGWQLGSRLTTLRASRTAGDLVRAGIMVASIDYRLAPKHPWPDQIVDVACAVRFLRADADELGINPARIAAWGNSAGGHLVSLLAVDGSSPSWDRGSYPHESSRVAAVVDEYGPTDLTTKDWPRVTKVLIRRVFGVAPGTQDPVLVAASPQLHVAAGDPPFLIVQGTADKVVPVSQSKDLAARLRAVGVPTKLVLVRRGGHGLQTPGESPSPTAISALIVNYLRQILRP
jgi:acetyl esterase/lipase